MNRNSVRKQLNKLPSEDKYMNRMANILERYSDLRTQAIYRYDRRSLVLDMATEAFLLTKELEPKVKVVHQPALNDNLPLNPTLCGQRIEIHRGVWLADNKEEVSCKKCLAALRR